MSPTQSPTVAANVLIYGLGLIAMLLVAARHFGKETIDIFAPPISPKYATNRKSYLAGSFLYAFGFATFYLFIVIYYPQLAEHAAPKLNLPAGVGELSTALGAIVVVIAALEVRYSDYELPASIFDAIRKLIHARIRIPEQVNQVAALLSSDDVNKFQVPRPAWHPTEIDHVTAEVTANDFDSSPSSTSYQWAVVSYLLAHLDNLTTGPAFRDFFRAQGLHWAKIVAEYNAVAREIQRLKQEGLQPRNLSNEKKEDRLVERVRLLRTTLGTFIACSYLYTYSDEVIRRKALKDLGISGTRVYFIADTNLFARPFVLIAASVLAAPIVGFLLGKMVSLVWIPGGLGPDLSPLANAKFAEYVRGGPDRFVSTCLIQIGIYTSAIWCVLTLKHFWRDFWPVPGERLEIRYDVILLGAIVAGILALCLLVVGDWLLLHRGHKVIDLGVWLLGPAVAAALLVWFVDREIYRDQIGKATWWWRWAEPLSRYVLAIGGLVGAFLYANGVFSGGVSVVSGAQTVSGGLSVVETVVYAISFILIGIVVGSPLRVTRCLTTVGD